MTTTGVSFGIDRLVRDASLLRGRQRLGLVTNEAARLASDSSARSRVALLECGAPLVRLFSPEHGLSARGADGAPTFDGTDPTTGLPVVSLYGARFAPPDDTLSDLDAVLFDIPDVGARFYTYIWTLSHVLEACARTGTPLVVLDRPNPLGGVLSLAEGPMLDERHCASFIGRWSMPVRHALTLGELARHWVSTRLREVAMEVIPCDGWRREMLWPALNLPWVPTSPAMPSFDSAMLYPGLCLFEATNVSVGRGTDAPFQQICAPWLRSHRLIEALAAIDGLGVRGRTEEVTPNEGPHAGVHCESLRLDVVAPDRLRPVALGLLLLDCVISSHPLEFAWASYPTAANPTGLGHFERLIGQRSITAHLGHSQRPVTASTIGRWTSAGTWRHDVRPALLYS